MRRIKSANFCVVFLFSTLLIRCCAHLRLTFPPARYPALDFLDNVRTKPPCGILKPSLTEGIRTSIVSGTTFNITWFQSYAHQGGYRLELLNPNDEVIAYLTGHNSTDSFVKEDEITRSWQTVSIPEEIECENCAIRILRQATEWGDKYHLFSCADVNIISKTEIANLEPSQAAKLCGNKGRVTEAGDCQCDRLYSGKACQDRDDCWADQDCGGGNGECRQLTDISFPQRQCLCRNGYFGQTCSHRASPYEMDKFDEALYQVREVGQDRNRIYWRIIGDELEVVLKFPGQSWVALGWKPKTQDKSCTLISRYAPATVAEPEVEPESKSEPESEPVRDLPPLPVKKQQLIDVVSVGVGNVSQITCPGPNQMFVSCPEINRLCEPSCEWTANSDLIPLPSSCPRQCGVSRCVCREGYVRRSGADDTCVAFNVCLGQDVALESDRRCPPNSTWAQCGRACEPTCANMYDTEPCPALCQSSSCSCSENYVRHQDRCIYWGDCPGENISTLPPSVTTKTTVKTPSLPFHNASNIFTDVPISIHVPVGTTVQSQDLKCGINETVSSCGKLCEQDCKTIFTRQRCDLCGAADCACITGYARHGGRCIYWDDCPLEVSGLQTKRPTEEDRSEKREPSDAFSLRRKTVADKQKPQSRTFPSLSVTAQSIQPVTALPRSTARRRQNVPEVIGDVCYGDWRWPSGCRDCDYRVSWNYIDETDEIEFSIETKAPSNWWTGIGFSTTGTMNEADMIMVKSRNGELTIHDMYSNDYKIPREDRQQNAYTPTVVGTHVNGVLRAQFTRKRDTGDRKEDYKFSDATCYKLLFPVSGGRLDDQGRLSKHITAPMVSAKKVCIRSCLSKRQRLRAKGPPVQPCESEFRYPTGCEGTACDYVAKWEYNRARKDVRFEISAREIGRWTGIGLSRDGRMTNSDIYTGWVYEGKAYMTDRFAYGRQSPAIDPPDRQDIYQIGGRVEDDIQTIWFHRKVESKDTITDYPLNKCYYFVFPVGGGRVLARKEEDFQDNSTPIGYHDLYQPRVSREKICICDANGKSIVPTEDEENSDSSRRKRQANPFLVNVDPSSGLPLHNHESELDETSNSDYDFIGNPFEYDGTFGEFNGETVLPEPEISTEPEPVTAEPVPETEPGSEPKPETVAEPETVPGAEPGTEPVAEPGTEPESEAGAQPEIGPESHKSDSTWSGHPMDCTDIVVGKAVGELSQVLDLYTVSRATPRLDEYYGGRQSIVSASGYERDGLTTVTFRRKLKAEDRTDHSIVPGPMTVIWAKGENSETLAAGPHSDRLFYELDILKYHGGVNRGALTIDFYEGLNRDEGKGNLLEKTGDRECRGGTAHPEGCQGEDCRYVLTWISDGDIISFQLDAAIQLNSWTGLGFSKDGSMRGADMVIAAVDESGAVSVTDQYSETYSPIRDEHQSIYAINAIYMNGHLLANFSRSLETVDSKDVSLTECNYFLYPTVGGSLQTGTLNIQKHAVTPFKSSHKICLRSCESSEGKPVVPVDVEPIATIGSVPETEPETVPEKKPHDHDVLLAEVGPVESVRRDDVPAYNLNFDIKNVQWKQPLSNRHNDEFKELAAPVKNAIDEILAKKYPGMEVASVDKFTQGKGVVAHTRVRAGDRQHAPSANELAEFVEHRAARGMVGTLEIEPESVTASRLDARRGASPEQIRNWIIIGIAGLLVLLAVLFAVCIILKTSKSKSRDLQGYSGTYPNGYQYPLPGAGGMTPMTDKMTVAGRMGTDNQAFQPTAHSRQFSQATTATQGKGSPEGHTSTDGTQSSPQSSAPAGVGETTYHEWYQKVASVPASQQHQEAQQDRQIKMGAGRGGGPYVSYPNDPMSYYTMNGQNRIPGARPMPVAGYYRPY